MIITATPYTILLLELSDLIYNILTLMKANIGSIKHITPIEFTRTTSLNFPMIYKCSIEREWNCS